MPKLAAVFAAGEIDFWVFATIGYRTGLIVDAGYSVRVVITGEPPGERYVDINFTDAPSLDFWVGGQLVEERVFSNIGEALKRIRPDLPRYLRPPNSD